MGDSGSWVVDAQTAHLVGVVIAGCQATKEAYIIPIRDIFADIERTMHAPSAIALPRVKGPLLEVHNRNTRPTDLIRDSKCQDSRYY